MTNCIRVILTTLVILILLSSPAVCQPYHLAVNCADDRVFPASTGITFEADQQYTGSNTYGYIGGGVPSSNTADLNGGTEGMLQLFNRWREGNFSYYFNVPPGDYAVTLYLAERTYHWKDYRAFSVYIEDSLCIDDLDIFEQVGRSYCLPMRFLTQCNDGLIEIDFESSLAGGTVCAISVVDIDPDATSPAAIQDLTAIGGYLMNIIDWRGNEEFDLLGYNIYRRIPGQDWELLTPTPHKLSRYIDEDVNAGNEFEYKVQVVDHWGNISIDSEVVSAVVLARNATTLPIYEMNISETNLYLLNADIWSDEYVDANVTLDGLSYPYSGVRYRGDITRGFSKKNYKINLPQSNLHQGREIFNLQSEMIDYTMLRDRLGYYTLSLTECLNPTFESIHLKLNDRFIGVYLDVEQVNNRFLERRGYCTGGNLYKGGSNMTILMDYSEYVNAYEKMNNPNSDWSDIIQFIEWINLSTPTQFQEEAGDWFNVDEYLNQLMALSAMGDFDFTTKNFFWYFNPVDMRWNIIPWDHNYAYWSATLPINCGTFESPPPSSPGNALVDKVLDDPLFRYSYCTKLERFLTSDYSIAAFESAIDQAYNEVEFDAIRDIYKYGWENPGLFQSGLDFFHQFNTTRHNSLMSQIPGFISSPELAPHFHLNEIQAENSSTLTDPSGDYDPWIEIYNSSPVELDLTGFSLTCDDISWILPEEAVVKGYSHLILWMDGETNEGPLHAPYRLPEDGGELLLESSSGQQADNTTMPDLSDDEVWARETDGSGNWTDDLVPTPDGTNHPPCDPSLLIINELMACNEYTLPDPCGEYDDWVEIYNPTEEVIELAGLYMTDNLDRPTKWALPDTCISPLSFVIIWFDDDPEQGFVHAPFKLSADGEEIGLFHRDGVTPIDTMVFPQQCEIYSWGRDPVIEDSIGLMTPSPGEVNNPVSVEPGWVGESVPRSFQLHGNYPNPFNDQTLITFDLPGRRHVRVDLFNVRGEKIKVLHEGLLDAGRRYIKCITGNLPSGVYFYQIEVSCDNSVAKIVDVGKMVLLK